VRGRWRPQTAARPRGDARLRSHKSQVTSRKSPSSQVTRSTSQVKIHTSPSASHRYAVPDSTPGACLDHVPQGTWGGPPADVAAAVMLRMRAAVQVPQRAGGGDGARREEALPAVPDRGRAAQAAGGAGAHGPGSHAEPPRERGGSATSGRESMCHVRQRKGRPRGSQEGGGGQRQLACAHGGPGPPRNSAGGVTGRGAMWRLGKGGRNVAAWIQ